MDHKLCIDLKRIPEGKAMPFSGSLPNTLLASDSDSWIDYNGPITVQGSCLKDEFFVTISFSLVTTFAAPCKICNEPTTFPLQLNDLSIQLETQTILWSEPFNIAPHVREALLLGTPLYNECHDNNCPERLEVSRYLHTNGCENTQAMKSFTGE